MPEDSPLVLFLCTGNSARSIVAEAILRDRGAARFRAASAGSEPRGKVHPMAIRVLESHGHETSKLRSKSWSEFAAADAPDVALAVTVCANAAAATCPVFHGAPLRAHWGTSDPAAFTGDEEGLRSAFEAAYEAMEARIAFLLPMDLGADRAIVQARLDAIGRGEDPEILG